MYVPCTLINIVVLSEVKTHSPLYRQMWGISKTHLTVLVTVLHRPAVCWLYERTLVLPVTVRTTLPFPTADTTVLLTHTATRKSHTSHSTLGNSLHVHYKATFTLWQNTIYRTRVVSERIYMYVACMMCDWTNSPLTCEVAGTIFSKESRKERLTTVGLTISSRPDTRVERIFCATLLNTRSSSNTEAHILLVESDIRLGTKNWQFI